MNFPSIKFSRISILLIAFFATQAKADWLCRINEIQACSIARGLVEFLREGPQSFGGNLLKLKDVQARGSHLEITSAAHFTHADFVTGVQAQKSTWKDWQAIQIRKLQAQICGVPEETPFKMLLKNGGTLRQVYLSIDGIPLMVVLLRSCNEAGQNELMAEDFLVEYGIRQQLARRKIKALSFEYIYSKENSKCTKASIGQARDLIEESGRSHVQWTISEDGRWVAKMDSTSFLKTMYYFPNLVECQQFDEFLR